MKKLLEGYSQAIQQKQNIINKVANKEAPYYELVAVEGKKRNKVLGFNGEPTRFTDYDKRLNDALLSKDLASVDQQINTYQQEISNFQSSMKTELAVTTKAKNDKLQAVESLKSQKTANQEYHKQLQESVRNLEAKLVPLRQQDNKVTGELSEVGSKIEALKDVKEMSPNTDSDISLLIQSLSQQKRAFILMQVWGKSDPDSEELIKYIKMLGFDAAYVDINGRTLLHLAAEKNDVSLLDIVVKQSKSSLECQTLLNHLANYSSTEFITKFLTYEANFSYGLGFIVDKNYHAAFKRLLEIKPSLIHTLDQLILYSSLEKGHFDIASTLIKLEIDCDKTLELAMKQQQADVLAQCFKLHPSLIKVTKLDKKVLLDFALDKNIDQLIKALHEYSSSAQTVTKLSASSVDTGYDYDTLLGQTDALYTFNAEL